ncbi:MAG: GNAT family N-acetyltransferase [Synechococcales bacterium]|nr:GNAT family N-acetyltransferase [Synechococcales bacterium]
MLEILEADPKHPNHAQAILTLLDEYARDPMGGGQGLSEFVKQNLPKTLAQRSDVYIILAFVQGEAAGLAICFEGFSTFACQPLLNIHDIVVSQPYRGQGLSKKLLQQAETIARRLGCCKLTLEVLEGNAIAQAAYQSSGFSGFQLDPAMGNALFWEKKLSCDANP